MRSSYFNPQYPGVADLKERARKRIPRFAFDYLEGGSGEELGLQRNRESIRSVQLRSPFLETPCASDLSVELFGHTYSAPFGIAPIGLQGMMWPRAPEILARAALAKNIPYVLSTVSSESLERIAEVSEGRAWFQFYNPGDPEVRKDLLNRVKQAGYSVLAVTVDVRTFGYRHRDLRNGLSMPPKMSISNIRQMVARPAWLWKTALAGKPRMRNLLPYMPKDMPTDRLSDFMNKTLMGQVDLESLKPIRDAWPGTLLIKGVITEEDAASAVSLGADGVVVSNHGGRQLDIGEAPIEPLRSIAKKYGSKLKVLMDSGLRSGNDIAAALACGAEFAFLGRPFVYGAGALGDLGGLHTINMLLLQLRQTMEQIGCPTPADLPRFLVR